MTEEQNAFWHQYLATLPTDQRPADDQVVVDTLSHHTVRANEVATLVSLNKKKAHCRLRSSLEEKSAVIPQKGHYKIVLNGHQRPVCIVKTTQVSYCPFNQVSAEFAAREGEGDGSYQCWHDAHWGYFSQYAKTHGLHFDEHSDVVLEEFEKVYPF
jgi:uncharacterized protein YhfF